MLGQSITTATDVATGGDFSRNRGGEGGLRDNALVIIPYSHVIAVPTVSPYCQIFEDVSSTLIPLCIAAYGYYSHEDKL